jgi:putative ABC transport system permease protein
LSVAGTIAGLVVGHWLARLLVRLAPPDIPRLDAVGVNMPLLLFAVMIATFSAAFIGLAPAVQAARRDRYAGLRLESRTVVTRGGWVRRLLIAGEVAVVVLLLTGASLLVRTFVKLRHVDLGFQPQHVLNVSARWPIGKLFPSTSGVRPWPRVQRAVEGLLDAVAGVAGVDAVGLIADVPLTGDPYGATVWRADAVGASGLTPPVDTRLRWRSDHNVVTAGYFPAMGIPILRGRNFGVIDRFSDAQLTDASAPRSAVVIVNSAFASRYFGADDPIGRTLIVPDDTEFGWSRTIVGVVGDVRGRAVAEAPAPAIYIPHSQHADVFVPSLIVRSALPPEAVAASIRQRIAAYDPTLLVQRIRQMDDVVPGALARPRFNLVLLGSFAIVALALSSVGIYGVLAYLVSQRTREIGIRMALGARAADVLWLVLREGMSPVALGAVAGMGIALLATRAIRSLLFGVTPLDPVSFVTAPIVLASVALLACYLPARRATRVDPLVALRED